MEDVLEGAIRVQEHEVSAHHDLHRRHHVPTLRTCPCTVWAMILLRSVQAPTSG